MRRRIGLPLNRRAILRLKYGMYMFTEPNRKVRQMNRTPKIENISISFVTTVNRFTPNHSYEILFESDNWLQGSRLFIVFT